MPAEARAERRQRRLGRRPLDQREQFLFLELYMIGQPDAQRVSHFRVGAGRKVRGVTADQDMAEQGADDRRVIGIPVRGVGGQEHLLLEAEVRSFLSLPVLEERGHGAGGLLRPRLAQPPGDDQGMVLIANSGARAGCRFMLATRLPPTRTDAAGESPGVSRLAHDRLLNGRRPFRSASAARAAASPGTPCTAPPGNAAALPKYKPVSGVR